MSDNDPLHDLFERAAPSPASPAATRQTLDELRPGFVGAHRRRRRRFGAAVAAATLAVAGGAAALGSIGSSSTGELDPRDDPAPDTTIGDADVVEDAIPDDVEDAIPDDVGPDDGTTEVGDPVVPGPTVTTASAIDDDDEPDDDGGDDDESHDSDDGPDDAEHDDEATPTTTEMTDESPTTSTTVTPAPGTHTGTTPGGSMTVEFDGETITVVSIDPAPGFTADLTEEKPHEVKVYFRDGTDEYEVEINFEDGELRIDAELDEDEES